MAKFILQTNERMYKSGNAGYIKSIFNTKVGEAYITSERFVFATNDIDFQLPLSSLRSIHKEKHGFAHKIILTSDSGDTYGLSVGRATNSDIQEWNFAFITAMEEVYPDFEIKHIGDRIEIIPSLHNPTSPEKQAADVSPESEDIKTELLNQARKQLTSSDFENAARSAMGVLALDKGNTEATAILQAAEAALTGGDPSIQYYEVVDSGEEDSFEFNLNKLIFLVSTIFIVGIVLSFFIPEVDQLYEKLFGIDGIEEY